MRMRKLQRGASLWLLGFMVLSILVSLAVADAVDISDEAAFNDMIARLRDAEGWGGEINDARLSQEQATLIEKINELPPNSLTEVLQQLGYKHARLGQHKTHGMLVSSRGTTGTFCSTKAHFHSSVPSSSDVFIEEDSAVELRSGASEPVVCACDEFDCSCRKQCFCKVQAEPFPEHAATPACPQCVNCDGTPADAGSGSGRGSDNGMPDRPFPAPHEFKCSCSFDGSGGGDEPNKNAMDCDCKESDCKCTRKCKCKTAS